MPDLRIAISDDVWPSVCAVLLANYEPPAGGDSASGWASQIAAGLFQAHLAELMQPPPPPKPVNPVTRGAARSARIRL